MVLKKNKLGLLFYGVKTITGRDDRVELLLLLLWIIDETSC
jgi:hypothetical protein